MASRSKTASMLKKRSLDIEETEVRGRSNNQKRIKTNLLKECVGGRTRLSKSSVE
jgi:hypothetical protein